MYLTGLIRWTVSFKKRLGLSFVRLNPQEGLRTLLTIERSFAMRTRVHAKNYLPFLAFTLCHGLSVRKATTKVQVQQ